MDTSSLPYFRSAIVGLVISLGQLIFVMSAGLVARQNLPESSDRTLSATYLGLVHWDTGWYFSIAKDGYRSPEQLTQEDFGNVCFFPGYPITVRLVQQATGIDWFYTFLLVSQLSSWVAWTYLVLLLNAAKISAKIQAFAIGLLLCHPAAYFLQTGYSESLFLASFLGMCYWSTRLGGLAILIAGLHGFMMTSTRIIGIPLTVIPLISLWFMAETRWRDLWKPCVIAAISALGAVSFFAWCHLHFGHWDMYFITEEAGWGIRPNYLALLDSRLYSMVIHPKRFVRDFKSPQSFDHLMATITVLVCCVTAIVEVIGALIRDSGWRRRLPWYVAVATLVYVPLAGQFGRQYASFTRYSFIAYVPFLIALSIVQSQSRLRIWTMIPLALLGLTGLATQLYYAGRFDIGLWTF